MSLVIKNCKTLYTMEDTGVLHNVDILVEDGKISAVGENLSAESTIDASEYVVLPGIVDAHSHIGGFSVGMEDGDLNDMYQPNTANLESMYGLKPNSADFDHAVECGTTTSAIAPGSGNVIGGWVCAVKSKGPDWETRVIKNPVALKMALGGNPKGVYGKKGQSPMTRMSIAQIIREYFRNVKEYMRKKEVAENDASKMPPFDLSLEHGIPVLKRELPVKIHCTTNDMLMAINVCNEFNVRFTIDHAWGASAYMEDIVNSGVDGIIYGPIGCPKYPGECGYMDISSLVELDKKGIVCAIMTDGPILKAEMLHMQAGEVVRYGGDVERVLRMLTINPATIIGLQDRIGSIKPGKDADIVLFRGTPALDTDAEVAYTIIDGNIVYQG